MHVGLGNWISVCRWRTAGPVLRCARVAGASAVDVERPSGTLDHRAQRLFRQREIDQFHLEQALILLDQRVLGLGVLPLAFAQVARVREDTPLNSVA